MNNILIILNDPPYGSERSYNGLRLAKALSNEDAHVTVFLLADAVACAKQGQKVPRGFYSIELMLKSIRSTMKILSEHTLHVDKVLVF
jgi:uncharacterized protein involved in oxidation of intracellular sulfur